MFFKEEIGDMLVMFEEDPETGEMTDKVQMFLIAMGEVMTPAGPVIVCRDKDGFQWQVNRNRIGEQDGAEYGWVKKSIHRIMDGFYDEGRK